MTHPSQPSAVPGGQLIGERQFRAMNTDIRLVTTDWNQSRLLSQAESVFHAVEARFSRFLDESELAQVNARSGWIEVSPEMIGLLALAKEFNVRTGGIFEPAVLPFLEAAGYDRSFERVAPESNEPVTLTAAGQTIADIMIDTSKGAIRKPAGLRIDLGGIGKGYAVDRAAAVLSPARDFLIDAGGDIVARGSAPSGGPWRIGIADPAVADADLEVVSLADGAIATSTIAKRHWVRAGRRLNHIIDPRSGEPVATPLVSVSVLAPTATEADVFAKTAFILGPEAGGRFLAEQGVAGLFVLDNGQVQRTNNWPTAASR